MRGTRKCRPAGRKGADEAIVVSNPKTVSVSKASNKSEAHFDLNDYPRRRWSNSTDDNVAHLLGRLKHLYKQSHPRGGAEAAKGKDHAAFDALQAAGELVDAVAGWALDHQVGLALNGLEFVPMQPSGTKQHPDYLKARRAVDAHTHEQLGGLRHIEFDPIVARRLLINLLHRNPGRFPGALTFMTIDALEALDFGDTKPMLVAMKKGRAHSRDVRRLELTALSLIEYRAALGLGKKERIQKDVAAIFGVMPAALLKWTGRLRKTFSDLAVERELSFARNCASQELAHPHPSDARPSSWDMRYGEGALTRAAAAYQTALRAQKAHAKRGK
jgi:hypothetical protein